MRNVRRNLIKTMQKKVKNTLFDSREEASEEKRELEKKYPELKGKIKIVKSYFLEEE